MLEQVMQKTNEIIQNGARKGDQIIRNRYKSRSNNKCFTEGTTDLARRGLAPEKHFNFKISHQKNNLT